ncbi:MAG TPA: methyltransferase, partial [Paralcaligenes sp.]
VDINAAALRLARINAVLAGAGDLRVVHSDLLRDVPGEFDLIIANPPYLNDSARRAYRHGGGPLGAGLSLAIVDSAIQRLSAGGVLLLYSGAAIVQGVDTFRTAVEEKLDAAKFHWRYLEIDPDVFGEELLCPAYAGADRIAVVLLTASRAPG